MYLLVYFTNRYKLITMSSYVSLLAALDFSTEVKVSVNIITGLHLRLISLGLHGCGRDGRMFFVSSAGT